LDRLSGSISVLNCGLSDSSECRNGRGQNPRSSLYRCRIVAKERRRQCLSPAEEESSDRRTLTCWLSRVACLAAILVWLPRALQYCFNWHQLLAIAGVTSYRFYFRLFPNAIKGPQVIEFLRALKAYITVNASCSSSGMECRPIAAAWCVGILKGLTAQFRLNRCLATRRA